MTEINIHLVSIQSNVTSINGTIDLNEMNHCVNVNSLWKSKYEISQLKYHFLCQNESNLLCFMDESYLCICDKNHVRVECFGYDNSIPKCSNCLGSGQCLKQNESTKDFLCLCPRCYSGRLCQFNQQEMSFTLDSLIIQENSIIQ